MAMVGDPVGAGLVESLGRPGGNATGLSIVATDLSGKRLQLLNEIVPGLSSVAVMSYGANPQSQMEARETQVAAGRLNLQLHSVPISAETSIEYAFEKIKKEAVQALIVVTDAMLLPMRSSTARETRSWIWPREIDCRRCIPIVDFPRQAA
jgi:putative ABC transport system substrate-binding protein